MQNVLPDAVSRVPMQNVWTQARVDAAVDTRVAKVREEAEEAPTGETTKQNLSIPFNKHWRQNARFPGIGPSTPAGWSPQTLAC